MTGNPWPIRKGSLEDPTFYVRNRSRTSQEDQSPFGSRRPLAGGRQKLVEARATRPRPHLDAGLTAWKVDDSGICGAARVLVAVLGARMARRRCARPRRLHALVASGSESDCCGGRDGEAAVEAFCEDYAFLTWGLLELFQASGDGIWLDRAIELTAIQTELFFDDRDAGWFSTTGTDASVLLRLKEDYDGAEPGAASVTVRNLLVLGDLLGDAASVERAADARTVRHQSGRVVE